MPSPFPGMDPYLEGYLWPDVHHRLATEISRQLMPKIRPHYVARIEIQVVQDKTPEAEIGIMYPDVEIVRTLREPTPALASGEAALASPPIPTAPLTVPVFQPEVRLASVEIRDVAKNELITTIEIISPVNKRQPDLTRYRQKRDRLYDAGVHLLEIDLLRRGQRPFTHQLIPACHYLITLTRRFGTTADVWPLQLTDKLPTLPVPLKEPDPDVVLDLGAVLTTVYDEAAYELSIDYDQLPPPPDLEPDLKAWLRELLAVES